MKLGTQIRLPDGREATVVFNSLIGVGIVWGLHDPDPADFEGTNGDTIGDVQVPDDWPWRPEALLREPWDGCEKSTGFSIDQFIGSEYEVIQASRKKGNT